MSLFNYIPFLLKLADHRAEIERIQTLAAPTIAEIKKIWPELLPLLQRLAVLLTPAMTELRKVWGELWPLVVKLATGLTAPDKPAVVSKPHDGPASD